VKSQESLKWKLLVFDAAIVAKLLYGLKCIPLTQADCNKIDAFHMRGFRKTLKIQHPYWPRVSNNTLLQTANQRLDPKAKRIKTITKTNTNINHP
jgi:hypothetical protein